MAKYFLRLGDREVDAELEETPGGLRVLIDDVWHDVGVQRVGSSPRYVLTLDDRLLEVLVEEEAQGFNLQIGGSTYEIGTVRGGRRVRRGDSDSFENGKWALHAPLTGVVIDVRVQVGDIVAQGDLLMVVEAMKMLNELRARVSGRVEAVLVGLQDRVEIGVDMLIITEIADASTDAPASDATPA